MQISGSSDHDSIAARIQDLEMRQLLTYIGKSINYPVCESMLLIILLLLLPLEAWSSQCESLQGLTIYPDSSRTHVTLRWSPGYCPLYRVYSASTVSGPFNDLVAEITETFCITEVNATRKFFYVVTGDSGGPWSGPSNVVGYVRITGVASSYSPLGLPFKFWDVPAGGIPTYGVPATTPSDILGSQLNCGSISTADRIIRQDNGAVAYRSAGISCAWSGSLETGSGMNPGRAYWYLNRTAANRDLLLAGEVDNAGNYATICMVEGAYTPYSWRDARLLSVNNLNLAAAGFGCGSLIPTSDRLIAQTGGYFMWRRCSDNTWQGLLISVEPGVAYWVYNRTHANGAWCYNYDASGNP